MTTSKLEKPQWHDYFDGVTKALSGKRAEIEVNSLALGSQLQAEWVPLIGITYEPRSDMLEVALEGLDHLIRHPQELYVERDAATLKSLEVVDADGAHQIVRLRDPLLLGASQ